VEHEELLGGVEDARAGFVLGFHCAQGHGGLGFETAVQTNV
jgi:hypothetical protein